jgi:hypothetical protein
VTVLRTLGSSRMPRLQSFLEAPDGTEADNSSSSSTSDVAAGLQAAVLAAPAAALQLIRQTGLVRAVFRDRIIVPQNQLLGSSSSSSRECVTLAQLQAGITRVASPRLQWPGCRTGSQKLLWIGSSCSRNTADTMSPSVTSVDAAAAAATAGSVEYTAVMAVDAATGQQRVSSNGAPCIAYAKGLSRGKTRQWFGSCGKAPRFAPGLPTKLCSADSSSSSSSSSDSGEGQSGAAVAADTAAAAADQSPSDSQQQPSQQQQQQDPESEQQQQQQQQRSPPDLAYDQPDDTQYYDYSDLQPLPQDDSSTNSAFDQPAHGAVVKDRAGGIVKPYTTVPYSPSITTPSASPFPARRRRRRRQPIGDNRVAAPAPIPNDLDSNLNSNLPPPAGLLRREVLAAGETVPTGVAFVEGATANAVPVTGGPTVDKAQQVITPHPCRDCVVLQLWCRLPAP